MIFRPISDHRCNELGESHQTKIGFCRDNNPNYHQFLYWPEKNNKTSAKLIPVKIADPKQPLARLRLDNGCSLRIMSQKPLTQQLHHVIWTLTVLLSIHRCLIFILSQPSTDKPASTDLIIKNTVDRMLSMFDIELPDKVIWQGIEKRELSPS